MAKGNGISEFAVNPNEKFICNLGTGFAANLIVGNSFKSVCATLTDRRVYFKGKALASGNGGAKIQTVQINQTLDVHDITGTKFILENPIWLLIVGIILTPVLIGIFFLIAYQLKHTTLFVIDYAGGSIIFEIKLLPMQDIKNFEKQLHLAKDAYIRETQSHIGSANFETITESEENYVPGLCPKCGATNGADFAFCIKCGNKLKQ